MSNKIGKAPAFQFYAGDFLSDINVTTMTMAQRGIYITLLAYEWIEGSLPSDILKLRILCGNHTDFDSDWDVVSGCFFEKDGRLYNRRLESERTNMIEYRERMSANGRKGAKSRWQGHSKAIAEPSIIEVEEEVEVKVKRNNDNQVFKKEFENDFWSIYPRRDNKKRAQDKFISLRKKGTSVETIINGLESYKKYWKQHGTSAEYIPMASTWLNQERFNDELLSDTKTVDRLSVKKDIEKEYMCPSCEHAIKTKEEDFTGNKALCRSCKEDFYLTKVSAMIEIRAKKAELAKPRSPRTPESGFPGKAQASTSSDESTQSLGSLLENLGVQ